MPTPCFLIVPSGKLRISLRRFEGIPEAERAAAGSCGTRSYHDATRFSRIVKARNPRGTYGEHSLRIKKPEKRSRLWARTCADCGYRFTRAAPYQVVVERLYVRDDGACEDYITLRDPPVGAMYDADWYPWKGPDGKSLCVQTPGGPWSIDGPASNCTMPGERTHRCWCRHGVPPLITVDKNCHTCAAGAGSIAVGTYHGFLQSGVLT